MTAFPAATFYTGDDAQDEGTVRQGLDDQLAATRQLIGAVAIEDKTISGGSVTPVSGTLRVEGQGAAADDLVSIVTTNLPEGSLLLLSIKDEGHVITVKHGTGAAAINLSGDIDFAMNKLEQRLLLQRMGTLWYELGRFGREKVHIIDATNEPQFAGAWVAGTPPAGFWKDENGVVRLYGRAAISTISAASSLLFTLPAGYRPVAAAWFAVVNIVNTSWAIDIMEIGAGGTVTIWATSGAAWTADALEVELDPIQFRAGA